MATTTADRNIDSSTYAIVQDAGRQLRVAEGDEVLIDLKKETNPGDSIVFDKILLVRNDAGVRVGTPLVDGAKVTGEVVGQESGKKVVVFKYRRRKDSRVKKGHRAKYTRVKVQQIQA